MKRIMLLTLLCPFVLFGCDQEEPNTLDEDTNQSENLNEEAEQDTENDEEVDEPQAQELMAQYRDFTYAEGKFAANDQLKVEGFQSKAELIEEANQFLSADYAQRLADLHYEDKEDGVYVVPMDGPVTLDEEKDFKLDKISDTEYRLTQAHSSDLHGNIELEVIFVKSEDKWVIHEVNENQQ